MKKTIKKTKPAKLGLTDHSREEQSLRNSELRYRRLFETAQDGILILDAKTGAITDVNPYLIGLLGYSREEFIEKKLWQIGAFKDVQASRDAFEALQKNEYIRYENLPLKAKDGRLIQVEFVSNGYLVGDEQVIQCDIRDITEHRRLIAAMQENERQYRTLVAQSPDGLFLIDLFGNFLTVNQAMCDGLEYSEEELRSMNIWDIVPDQYLDQHRTRLRKILNGERLVEPLEYAVRGKDGKIFFVEIISAPYYSGEGIIGFQGIARDITKRKRTEETLRESEEKFRILYQNSPIPAFTWQKEGNNFVLVGFNSMAEAATKGIAPLFIGKTASELYKDRPEILQNLHRCYSEKRTVGVELPSQHFFPGRIINATFGFIPPEMVMVYVEDITERKRAEEAMHAAKNLLDKTFASLDEAVLVVDPNTRTVIACNAAVERIFGYAEKDVIGRTTEFMHVDRSWFDRFGQELFPALDAAGMFHTEFQMRREDGSIFPTENTVTEIKDALGRRTSVVSVIRDITARKQVEQALREREQRLTSIYDTVGDVIFQLAVEKDGRYRFASVNRAFLTTTGLTSAQVVGKRVDEVIPEPSLSMVLEKYAVAIREKGIVRWEETSEYPTGRLIGEVSIAPVFDEAGHCTHLVGAVHDITERKRAEARIAYQANLLAQVSDAIVASDEQYRLTAWNMAAEAVYGWTAEEVLGRDGKEIVRTEWASADPEEMRQMITETGRWRGEATQQRKNGTRFPVEVSSLVLRDDSGQITGYVSVNRDITARHRAEEALRQAEEKYRSIFENAAEGIYQSSLDGHFTSVNSAMARLLGYASPDEVVTGIMSIRDQFYADPGYRTTAMQQLDQKGTLENFDSECLRKDGSRIWISENARAVRDANGTLLYYEGFIQDITERKQAEDTLRQRLTELEALHTVSTVLRTAQTRDEALPILLDETLAALETDAGAVWLYHADSGELHAAVTRGWYRQLSEIPMKPGEGVAGTVFASGRTRVSAEIVRDPLVRQPATGEIPAGWGGVCLPIRTGATAVGVLFVAVRLPRQITAEQVKLLESLTGMAGTTLHRMSLHEETVRQLDRLQALHNIDLTITASFDLRMTLNILLEHVAAQLKVDAASVLLLNPHSQTLEYAAGHGFRTRSVQTAHIRLGESFAGRAVLERRAVHADDPAQIQESPPFAALWAGEGFAAYYGVPLIVKGEVKGVLEVYHRAPFHPAPDWIAFLETLAGQAAVAIDSAQLFENLQRSSLDLALAYDATIEGWSRALDLRDKETKGHTLRVTEITMRLAKAMGIGDAELVHIRRGGLLHDIGKMGVPDSILLKPGPLTDDEWKVMYLHPQLAYDLLSPISYLRPALDIPYCHHEKWDGSGYPRGMKGEQIPFSASIFAVVDVWDALRSVRPYRPAWAEEKVLEHIQSLAGTHFDPQVVKVCLESGVLGTQAPE